MYSGLVPGPKPFTAETLTGDLADGPFPQVRTAMLEFVGQFLLDYERAAQALGLTMAQARVLGFAAMKPLSQREIADKFGCDPSNISGKVDRLVELGLVERRVDPHDGRVRLIAATDDGVALATKLCQSREWLAGVLGGLRPDEVETVHRAMELLARRLPPP
jgi:DNA-binding MarR family transcriptional regulator